MAYLVLGRVGIAAQGVSLGLGLHVEVLIVAVGIAILQKKKKIRKPTSGFESK